MVDNLISHTTKERRQSTASYNRSCFIGSPTSSEGMLDSSSIAYTMKRQTN